MAKRPTPEEIRRQQKEERRRALVAECNANPNGFFTYEETGIVLGFGQDAMSMLAGIGAPVAFRKMNPSDVRGWIARNQDKIGKLEDRK